jgi:hypothetical protein
MGNWLIKSSGPSIRYIDTAKILFYALQTGIERYTWKWAYSIPRAYIRHYVFECLYKAYKWGEKCDYQVRVIVEWNKSIFREYLPETGAHGLKFRVQVISELKDILDESALDNIPEVINFVRKVIDNDQRNDNDEEIFDPTPEPVVPISSPTPVLV